MKHTTFFCELYENYTDSAAMNRAIGRSATLIALALVAATTLTSAPSQADRVAETIWSCVVCGEAGATDVLLNLLLFAPLGVAFRTLGLSWPRSLAAALGLTLAIETTQATLLAGRDASLGDVLANTLGALGGWWLWPKLAELRQPTRQQARRTAVALWSASTMVWLLSGWGMHPEGSGRGPWVGQIGRVWSGHVAFPGTVDHVALNGIEVPNDSMPSVASVGTQLALRIAATRHDSVTPSRPVALLRIVDGVGAQQLSAVQRGEGLLLSARVRAARWRVRTPTWRYDDAMRAPSDVPWVFDWRWDSAGVVLRSGPAGASTLAALDGFSPSVGLGWVFVHPFAAAISQQAFWWTALWLALWVLPFGWCLRWLARQEAFIGGVAMLGSFLAASWLTGLPLQAAELAVMGGMLLAASGRGSRAGAGQLRGGGAAARGRGEACLAPTGW